MRWAVKTLGLSFYGSTWASELNPQPPEALPWGRGGPGHSFPLSGISVSSRIKVHVPMGFAAFPCEVMHVPEKWVTSKYPKLISYSYMPRGGHFAAFEEPELLAQDIHKFVGLLERQ